MVELHLADFGGPNKTRFIVCNMFHRILSAIAVVPV
jgi:hypothetical protein